MALLDIFRKKPRAFVIGLDGTPYTLVKELVESGDMPNFGRLIEQGTFLTQNSSLPSVSSVAWSCFMTGQNPAKHNIFGFVHREADSYDLGITNSRRMTARALWEVLSDHGKSVVVMSVPVTFPPRAVNGVMISGFLAGQLSEKAVHPASVYPKLKELGYEIDTNPALAAKDRDQFLQQLHKVFDNRKAAMFHLMEQQPWDFFIAHFMDTDRLHHFFWNDMEDRHPKYHAEFVRFYRKVDEMLGELEARLPKGTPLIILSDHGFCRVKKDVALTYWMMETGWTAFTGQEASPLAALRDLDEWSKAYTLIPGRIHVNLKGREPRGSVEPGAEYETVCDELVEGLLQLEDPDSGEKIVQRVVKKEDVYRGPHFDAAPDLIAVPTDGYDLRTGRNKQSLLEGGSQNGMHTYDNAFFYINREVDPPSDPVELTASAPTILKLMDVPIPEDLDGQALL